MKRKTYAAVGTGGRAPMFLDPIVDTYRADCELVGLCDSSEVRRTFHQKRLASEYGIAPVPTFSDFDQMMRETHPEIVIVCTPDALHHEYIVRALEAGADVISEKPLTIRADFYAKIAEAVRRTGKKVRTTFNMRWTPGIGKIRQLIADGTIGCVRHVDFEYYLNTSHGADYFRRWHSEKSVSGGLLLHKSTHHFDIINWWLDAIPAEVFAMGKLCFYGRENAIARGDGRFAEYPRYTGEPAAAEDPFAFDLNQSESTRDLYLNAEAETGYLRDRNVFRAGIDIEDSMSVMIRYRTGEIVNYSLNAYCPDEGFRASICGDRGRIDYTERHASHILTGDKEVQTDGDDYTMHVRVQRHFEKPVEFDVEKVSGGHGGGDALLQCQMFSSNPPVDATNRNAGHEQGAASLLIGAAANQSMQTGQPVRIEEMVSLRPDKQRLHELV